VAEAAATAIRSLLGETDAQTSAEEIAWAFRKTLEHAASEQPVVVVVDDIQWGEETFLDLIEHVALLSSGASILLLCLARPELIERRATWPVTLRLEPLGQEAVSELIPEHIVGELRDKIVRAAGGIPLFIEEMLAMAREAEEDVVVPPTLQALLAACLDQLEPDERSVLERGAVDGEIFHRGAVQALGQDETPVTPRLAALVRKHLIRADNALVPGEDAFRFRHLLILEAAYDALPKATRAELHERCATWLGQHGAELVELDEVVGYHLEQACRYRTQLDLPQDEQLAVAARRRLTSAGRRASFRQDFTAAVSLLERASALVPLGEVDVALEIDLVEALFETGKGGDALTRAGSIAERAAAAGDRVGELCGRIQEDRFRTLLDPEGATDRLATLAEQALPVFHAAGDDLALYIGYSALGQVANIRGKWDALLDAYERAAAHARQAGLPYELFRWRAGGRFAGTTPVSDLLAWLDEQEARGARDTYIRGFRGRALARLGRFDEARAILADARAEQADRGAGIGLTAVTGLASVDVELLAGDPTTAAELGAEGWGALDELGEKGLRSTAAGKLAQALYALDRLDEAEVWAGRAAELGASDDAITQMLSGHIRAKILARRGEHAEAGRLARAAVAIGEDTDWLDGQAETYADLAEVLSLAGRTREAAEALEQALARYERKGNIVMSQRTRARLAEVRYAATR
jgi:tetratricopeptide (TPR) repeat protein